MAVGVGRSRRDGVLWHGGAERLQSSTGSRNVRRNKYLIFGLFAATLNASLVLCYPPHRVTAISLAEEPGGVPATSKISKP